MSISNSNFNNLATKEGIPGGRREYQEDGSLIHQQGLQ